jgi:hypothetical protein
MSQTDAAVRDGGSGLRSAPLLTEGLTDRNTGARRVRDLLAPKGAPLGQHSLGVSIVVTERSVSVMIQRRS